ncbi:hypothetical protein FACS189452_02610 [Bacteroidia bacterium]|nr:hypothetical protein FACS189452_02610 [Bacteroidia bacterium]
MDIINAKLLFDFAKHNPNAAGAINQYNTAMAVMETIIEHGTLLGDMELLGDVDKAEYCHLSKLVQEWENKHYPFPINVYTPQKKVNISSDAYTYA